MKKIYYTFIFAFIVLLGSATVQAQDFVYKPKNPAFGGDTFNYQWLLNSAESQNLLDNPDTGISSFNSNTSLEDFTENLNRQLLSQISRQIATNQFGENGLEEGSYTVGAFQIDVNNTTDGLSVTILDTSLGEQTQIIIPFF